MNLISGVEGVMVDKASNRLKVLGNVDPWVIRERLNTRAHKNVEFVSPENPPKMAAAGEQATSEEVGDYCVCT